MIDPGRFSKVTLYVALTVALLAALVLPGVAVASSGQALLTIADGPVELWRGAVRHAGVEGLVLAEHDIVRTRADTRVARLEFHDGRVLDLGPSTQALLLSDAVAAAQGLGAGAVLVFEGWAKLAVPAAVNAGAGAGGRLVTARWNAAVPPAGSALLRVGPGGDTLVFAEARGTALWRRVRPGQTDTRLEAALREGDLWSPPPAPGDDGAAPAATRLHAVPRALADRLPRRAAQFEGRTIEARGGPTLDPRELAPWLRAEPWLVGVLRPAVASRRSPAWRAARDTAAAPARATAAAAKATRPARLIDGLAWPSTTPTPVATASIALEPTALLADERVAMPLPSLATATARRQSPTPPAAARRETPRRTVAP
jgi:hypothetical protein